MPRAITLRSNFTAADLRRLARLSKDASQARRLLALAANYDGAMRPGAARIGISASAELGIARDGLP